MNNKTICLAALVVVFSLTSCNNNTSSKITDADMNLVENQKTLENQLPVIEFDKTEHNFGTIKEGDVVETDFMVKNIGDSDLIISDAQGSCGCTVPVVPKEPIKPGSSAPIKVSFNSQGKPGQQSKTVTLTTNTKIGKETFTIKADVTPKTSI